MDQAVQRAVGIYSLIPKNLCNLQHLIPYIFNLCLQTKEGKQGKSRAFELTCVFANSANLLLSSWERACVY